MSVRVPPHRAEIARARLLERFPDGFEEHDLPDALELAVYTDEAGEAAVRELALGSVAWTPVAGGWEDGWKSFHRPTRVAGLWIGPPWEDAPGEGAVVVDPGRAFGTGAHPTTRACIELLARLQTGSLVDAGCGSGVVAVAALRLGFGPVVALDRDAVAVEVARETARRNGVELEVRQGDVLLDDLPAADVVVANIELRVVEALLERRPAPVAVTAGYLAHESPRATGWEVVSRIELDGWAAHALATSPERGEVARRPGH